MGKSILDGLILHAGDPEPFERLPAARLMIDQTENKFAFTSGIRCADKAFDIITLHQFFQDTELLPGGS